LLEIAADLGKVYFAVDNGPIDTLDGNSVTPNLSLWLNGDPMGDFGIDELHIYDSGTGN
jgi:hypothetical protein